MLDSTAFFVTWLAGSVRLASPLLLAATGEIYAERSGVVNVGIEGTILLGALASFLAAYTIGTAWLGVSAALVAGLLANLFLAWLYVTVQANQVVVGITFNLLAPGLSRYLYRTVLGAEALTATIPMLPGNGHPSAVARSRVGTNPIRPARDYFTLVLVAMGGRVLYHWRFGLNLRAAGENPKAAAAAGIGVRRVGYFGVLALRGGWGGSPGHT
jgi:simple sugar transport system permease protein